MGDTLNSMGSNLMVPIFVLKIHQKDMLNLIIPRLLIVLVITRDHTNKSMQLSIAGHFVSIEGQEDLPLYLE